MTEESTPTKQEIEYYLHGYLFAALQRCLSSEQIAAFWRYWQKARQANGLPCEATPDEARVFELLSHDWQAVPALAQLVALKSTVAVQEPLLQMPEPPLKM